MHPKHLLGDPRTGTELCLKSVQAAMTEHRRPRGGKATQADFSQPWSLDVRGPGASRVHVRRGPPPRSTDSGFSLCPRVAERLLREGADPSRPRYLKAPPPDTIASGSIIRHMNVERVETVRLGHP